MENFNLNNEKIDVENFKTFKVKQSENNIESESPQLSIEDESLIDFKIEKDRLLNT
jgi:hypothetical protein